MTPRPLASAALRAIMARRDGPSLYEICDPLLRRPAGGDSHLATFYRTALGNPALRVLLRGAGLPELADAGRRAALVAAITEARDAAAPHWERVGRPVAELVDTLDPRHPAPPRAAAGRPPAPETIETIIRACGRQLLASYARNGFIPAYAAFNLIGDPDMRGRDVLAALSGLESRGYKNSTLLFNLARVFIARSSAREVVNPPWRGVAERMWQPMQIRHRSAYYDAFFIEALLAFIDSGLASAAETAAARRAIAAMAEFCLKPSRERVHGRDGRDYDVVTALAPAPHPRFSRFFAGIKERLGFGIYVPDCDTTACAISAATQAGVEDPLLDQPTIDFYAGYQVASGANAALVSVPLNDHLDYSGAIVTWIDNLKGERPYGNDLDPTLNLDVLEASFRNAARWRLTDAPERVRTIRGIIAFQRRLAESGAFADPRSHIYYLPELYCAYFGRCHAAFMALPAAARAVLDPEHSFAVIRGHVLAYVRDHLAAREMNAFDAALALIALGHLRAEPQAFAPALASVAAAFGEGGRRAPYFAYEWNKMKTPTRILVGGPEVTSAFVLMGLALARRACASRRT